MAPPPPWCSGRCSSPSHAPDSQTLAAFLTFGIAFLARPVGAFLFGHFGDRVGRKTTLVASMLVMGISTTLIGVLPGYASAGRWRPILLCLLRLGQGLGLGGEWGGAALLATENAPAGKRAWFGMFPQLGPPIGFLALQRPVPAALHAARPRHSSWPGAGASRSCASAVLVGIGLYVRGTLPETVAFARAARPAGAGAPAAARSAARATSAAAARLAAPSSSATPCSISRRSSPSATAPSAAYPAHNLP